jgi:hypothetical protein
MLIYRDIDMSVDCQERLKRRNKFRRAKLFLENSEESLKHMDKSLDFMRINPDFEEDDTDYVEWKTEIEVIRKELWKEFNEISLQARKIFSQKFKERYQKEAKRMTALFRRLCYPKDTSTHRLAIRVQGGTLVFNRSGVQDGHKPTGKGYTHQDINILDMK